MPSLGLRCSLNTQWWNKNIAYLWEQKNISFVKRKKAYIGKHFLGLFFDTVDWLPANPSTHLSWQITWNCLDAMMLLHYVDPRQSRALGFTMFDLFSRDTLYIECSVCTFSLFVPCLTRTVALRNKLTYWWKNHPELHPRWNW